MARMYSRKKGKSGSKKPIKSVPTWAPYKGADIEKLVIKYAKSGEPASKIGIILRDRYGIHSVLALTGKKITAILNENKLTKKLPEDFLQLIKKLDDIKMHLEKNKQDKTARRGVILTRSSINRLMKYYKKNGKIDKSFKLDEERLKMYLG